MIQLQAMLYQISFNMQKRQVLTDRNSKLGDDLFQFILAHLTGELSAELFEARFRLGYRQLNLIFRQQFKTTIRQKVIELRVDHAFHLLMLGETIAASDKSGFKFSPAGYPAARASRIGPMKTTGNGSIPMPTFIVKLIKNHIFWNY
jgi:AraC-like DNA-binding protein